MPKSIGVVFPWLDWDHFPSQVDAHVAQRVLSAWTAAWHPELLCQADALPTYLSPYQARESLDHRLLFIPDLPELADWLKPEPIEENFPSGGYHRVVVGDNRQDAAQQALRQLGQAATSDDCQARLSDMFMSLGYCYFQLQLLTRRMHGAMTLGESSLVPDALRAARGWQANDPTEMRAGLSGAFGVLANERCHFYPVDAYFLDVRFWHDLDVRDALVELQRNSVATNWSLPPSLLETWEKASDRETMENVRELVQQRLSAKTLGLLGAEDGIVEWTLMSTRSIVDSIQRARDTSRRVLGKRPSVFARAKFGATPRTPDVLKHFRYEGVVMSPLGLGRWPRSPQSRTQWVSVSQQSLDAVGTIPLDPGNPATMFHLAHTIAESMEKDYVATVLFASEDSTQTNQGKRLEWFGDLQAGMEFGGVLGKFSTVLDYLQKSSPMGQRCDLSFDAYVSPYLRADVRLALPTPVSKWRCHWEEHANSVARSTLDGILQSLDSGSAAIVPMAHGCSGAEALARTIPKKRDASHLAGGKTSPSIGTTGWMAINPFSANLRSVVGLPALSDAVMLPDAKLPAHIRAIRCVNSLEAVVDVPSFGFAWIPAAGHAPQKVGNRLPSMLNGLELRNEFLRARIDEQSGGLAALHDFQHRSNRASQRLVWVDDNLLADNGGISTLPAAAPAIRMIAEKITVVRDDDVAAAVVARGTLIGPDGGELAAFWQEFTLSRGSREMWIRIRLEPRRAIRGDPWRNYLGSRLAWRGESDRIQRWVQDTLVDSTAPRFESPLYSQMKMGDSVTTYFSLGLPFHARPEPFRLDTLLVVAGETAREFEVGLGVDSRAPWQAAMTKLSPPAIVASEEPVNQQGWFLQVDRRNVNASILEQSLNSPRFAGMRLQLMELEGVGCQVGLRAWRPIIRACKVDADGGEIASCEVLDGVAKVFMRPHEWTELELRW